MSNQRLVEVRFAGNNIKPDKIRSKELAELIASYEDAIASILVHENPELSKDTITVSLVAIGKSSIGLQFLPNLEELTFPAASRIAKSISRNDYSDLPHHAVESLRSISSFTKRHGCDAEFRAVNGESKVEATLHPTTVIPTTPKLIGETILYGEVKRVGGASPRVMITTLEGDTVYCDLSEALAIELGHRLYTDVGLKGKATWNAKTLELDAFVVESITDYSSISAPDAFAELRDLIGDDFADIEDVQEYVTSLRYDNLDVS